MGRAVLEIAGDIGPLTRALGQIPGRVKKAADAIRGEFRKAMEESAEGAEKAAVAHQRAAAAMRASSKAAGKAASDEQKAQARIVQQESNYRTSAVRQEVRAVEAAEKQKTRAVSQEARKRERAAAQEMAERRRAAGNVGRAVGDGAVSFGRDAVGMTRGFQVEEAAKVYALGRKLPVFRLRHFKIMPGPVFRARRMIRVDEACMQPHDAIGGYKVAATFTHAP